MKIFAKLFAFFGRNFRKSGAKYKLGFYGTLILFSMLCFFRLNPLLLYTPDSSAYIILANSILNGDFYHDYSAPDNPIHILYPPMYPFLLTLSAIFFGESVIAAKLVTCFSGMAMLAGIYWVVRKSLSEKVALVVMMLVALSPIIVAFSAEVMAEIPALMFALFALFFVFKFSQAAAVSSVDIEAAKREKTKAKYLILVALMFSAAFLSRSIWLCLWPAIGLYLLWEKKWKDAIFFGVLSLLLITPWIWRDRWESQRTGMGGGSYVSQILNTDLDPPAANQVFRFAKRIKLNAAYYSEHVGRMTNTALVDTAFSPAFAGMFPSFLSRAGELFLIYAVVFFVTLGAVVCFFYNSRARLLALVAVAHFLLLMIFPYKEVRYLVPLIPFFILFLILGFKFSLDRADTLIKFLLGKINGKARFRASVFREASWLFLLVFIFFGFFWNLRQALGNMKHLFYPGALAGALMRNYDYDWGSPLIGIGNWIRNNTPKDSIVVSDRKEIYFYSKRLVVPTEPTTQLTISEFDWMMWSSDADYIVESEMLGKSPLDTKRYGSRQYEMKLVGAYGDLVVFEAKERLFYSGGSAPDYKDSIKLLEEGVKNNPDSVEIINNLGVFYLKDGQKDKALESLKKAAEQDKNSAQIHFNLGTAYMENERYDEAELEFRRAQQIQFVHRLVPMIKNNLEIIGIFRKIKASGDDKVKAELYNQAALIYYSRGKYEQALVYLEKALELNNKSALTYTGLGKVKETLGRLDEALADYEQALDFNPNDNSLKVLLTRARVARALMSGERQKVEVKDLGKEKEKVIDSNQAESYNYMGVLYWETGEPMRAIPFLEKAVELDDKFILAYENMGVIYEVLGKKEKAKESYGKELELDPGREFARERWEFLRNRK